MENVHELDNEIIALHIVLPSFKIGNQFLSTEEVICAVIQNYAQVETNRRNKLIGLNGAYVKKLKKKVIDNILQTFHSTQHFYKYIDDFAFWGHVVFSRVYVLLIWVTKATSPGIVLHSAWADRWRSSGLAQNK